MDMDTVIQINNLTKYFGDFCAVDAVTFKVNAGEVVGYLGPNGSGKTTTIRMLMGLLLPSAGSARVLGYDIEANPEAIRLGFPRLTADQTGWCCTGPEPVRRR